MIRASGLTFQPRLTFQPTQSAVPSGSLFSAPQQYSGFAGPGIPSPVGPPVSFSAESNLASAAQVRGCGG